MHFPYAQYRQVNLAEPAFLLIFSLFAAVSVLIWQLVSVRKGAVEPRQLITSALIFAISLFFFYLNGRVLARGGIHLLKETEADAVTRTGQIESISPDTQKYYYNERTALGYEIVIDGRAYTVIETEGFAVGDQVDFTCLPRSGIILAIEMAE